MTVKVTTIDGIETFTPEEGRFISFCTYGPQVKIFDNDVDGVLKPRLLKLFNFRHVISLEGPAFKPSHEWE